MPKAGGFAAFDAAFQGPAESDLGGTKMDVIGTAVKPWRGPRSRRVEAHGHAANVSTPRLRSALWHGDEIDTDVKLGEPESMDDLHAPDPEPFDREKAISRWQQKLATMIGRGFAAPPFSGLVLGLEAPSSRRWTARGFTGRLFEASRNGRMNLGPGAVRADPAASQSARRALSDVDARVGISSSRRLSCRRELRATLFRTFVLRRDLAPSTPHNPDVPRNDPQAW